MTDFYAFIIDSTLRLTKVATGCVKFHATSNRPLELNTRKRESAQLQHRCTQVRSLLHNSSPNLFISLFISLKRNSHISFY